MDAPCYDDIWMLVESARGESLIARRCLNMVINREPSLFIFWNGKRLDVPARGLLSRLPLVEVSLECQAVLPMNSPSAP